MFNWMKQPIASEEGFNPEDYTFEGDGQYLAFEEAYADIAEINEGYAEMNARGVNEYASAWHQGGQQAATEAATSFAQGPVMEAFLSDAWEKLKSMVKKLWEKIKAFFHSARQYFDAFFLSGKKFAEKYEDELDKVDLDKFKYAVYDWKLDKVKQKTWADVQKMAVDNAKKANVAIKDSYNIFGDVNGWVGPVTALTELWVNDSKKLYSTENPKIDATGQARLKKQGWKFVSDDTADDAELAKQYQKTHVDVATLRQQSPDTTVTKISTSQRKEVTKLLCDAIIGSSKGTVDGMKKELAKELRGGKTEPREREISSGDISTFVGVLKDGEELDDIKQWESDMNDSFGDIIDKLNDTNTKDDPDLKQKVKNQVTVFTIGKDVSMAVFKVFTDAIKERNKQYQGCLSAALHYHAPKD